MPSVEPIAPGRPAIIYPATWRDLNALRHLEKICFPKDAWPLLDLVGVLTMSNVIRYKAVIGDQMVGFIAGDVSESENLAWVATLAVLPEARGRGIGRALLQACEARLQVSQVKLNVRVSNSTAIGLYESEGYLRAGFWPGYYTDGEDALVMEKYLNGGPGASRPAQL
jgi:ribosomal-protein-alanine N-acetyltransferase